MTKILFICHGNICRSVMAEYVFKKMIAVRGLEDDFCCASAAVSREEIGNPVYPAARMKLAEHGIFVEHHAARQMTAEDYAEYDMIIGMDSENLRKMKNIAGGDPQNKCSLLMEYTSRGGEVADPWYTGNFNAAWRDIEEGCRGLLNRLTENQQ